MNENIIGKYIKGNVEIDNYKLNETFGIVVDFKNYKEFGGFTRDTAIFKEILDWGTQGIVKVELIQNATDEYFFRLTDRANKIIDGTITKSKSISPVLMDVTLLDSEFEKFSSYSNKNIIDEFLNKPFNPGNAIRNLKKENINNVTAYWKKLAASPKSYFSRWVAKRIRMLIYVRVKHFWNVSELNSYVTIDNRCDELANMLRSKIRDVVDIKVTDDEKKYDNCIKGEAETFISSSENKNRIINSDNSKSGITQVYESISLNTVVGLFRVGKWMIPTFQRDYVWKQEKVIKLLNSIANQYPIGNLLVAQSAANFEEKNQIMLSVSDSRSNNRFAILDGQQRITSITRILLYERIANKMNEEDRTELIEKFLEETNNICYIEDKKIWENALDLSGPFISAQELSKKEIPVDTTDEKLKKILSSIDDYKFANADIRKSVRELIGQYKINATILSGVDIQNLVKIFENINSGSQNLTHIDLLHSLFYGHDEKYNLLETLKKLREKEGVNGYGLSNDLILQVWKLVFEYERFSLFSPKNINEKFNPQLQIKDLFTLNKTCDFGKECKTDDKKDIDNFRGLYNKLSNLLFLTVKVLNEFVGVSEYKWLPNNAFFINVAALLLSKYNKQIDGKPNNEVINDQEMKKLLPSLTTLIRVIIKRTLLKDYSANTTGKIVDDVYWIFDKLHSDYEEKVDKRTKNWISKIDTEFKNLSYGSSNAMYKLYIALLVSNVPISIVDGSESVKVKLELHKEINKDMHHFLPANCEKHSEISKEERNQVKNIILISKEENRDVIVDKSPYEYMKKIKKDDKRLRLVANSHLFDFNKLKKYLNAKTDETKLLNDVLESREKNIAKVFQKKWGFN